MNGEELMLRAIELAERNAASVTGGPFGAVVVKDGKVIAEASNTVTVDNDPTAHAEVNAIRKACAALGTFDLSGCELYTSCEPCPMCLAACYWAHIDKVYYAADREDSTTATSTGRSLCPWTDGRYRLSTSWRRRGSVRSCYGTQTTRKWNIDNFIKISTYGRQQG